ncbi:ABC transporter permease [Paracoccus sp. P2]|uniref:ABC transporter permease n=1 Tax=Paracoccus TaxID=265 RepID=UPI002ED78CAB
MRNAMLPVVTVIGDQAAALLNGAVVAETIFGFPGVGKLMIDAILQRDFNVVLAAIMVMALAIIGPSWLDAGHRSRTCAAAMPALRMGARLAVDHGRRCAWPSAAGADHRRHPEHHDGRRRRGAVLGRHRIGVWAGCGPCRAAGQPGHHAAGRHDHVLPVAADRGDRALYPWPLGAEPDHRPG